jgi:hypothetical protein
MENKVTKVGENRWVIELEENPDNPDELLMAIPPEALAQAGWDFGDTLEWKIDPLTHQITLEKKEPTPSSSAGT